MTLLVLIAQGAAFIWLASSVYTDRGRRLEELTAAVMALESRVVVLEERR